MNILNEIYINDYIYEDIPIKITSTTVSVHHFEAQIDKN